MQGAGPVLTRYIVWENHGAYNYIIDVVELSSNASKSQRRYWRQAMNRRAQEAPGRRVEVVQVEEETHGH